MNYQQAIADAIKLIRSVAAATVTTTGSAAGSGFLSCFPAAADAAADSVSATATDAAVVVTATTTTADAAAGSGFCFCSAAVAAATTAADAANVLIPEGSHMRALTPCNILAVEKTDRSVYWDAHKPQSEKSYMAIFQIGNMPLRGCGWRNTHCRFHLS